jgi:hypothetical protein
LRADLSLGVENGAVLFGADEKKEERQKSLYAGKRTVGVAVNVFPNGVEGKGMIRG